MEPKEPARRRRVVRVLVSTIAALAALALAGPSVAATAAPCSPDVRTAVLPTWARTGFSDRRPVMPYALGASGRIAAIVFGYPLLSPPGTTRNNKILWISHSAVRPLSPLRIRAQRMVGSRPVGAAVVRTLDTGPGPSIVDLPAAGCWRLALTWSGRSDTLDLRYRPS
jgi:hypothetical protein